MRRRFHLMVNPLAGRGQRRLVEAVTALLSAGGAEIQAGGGHDEASALAQARAAAATGGAQAIIAAGGDGTIRLAARAVAGTPAALGVIPLGTGNVLAHEIALPGDAEGLARLLREGEARPIHTATANGELFLLMAGAGFDGRVIAALDLRHKQRLGKLAYAAPVLAALRAGADPLEVEVDGARRPASWAIVTNASRYGGRFLLTGGTSVREPGLVAVLFGGRLGRERIGQLIALARGRLDQRALSAGGDVAVIACRRAVIRSPGPVPVQIDGDAAGHTPLRIESGGPEIRLIVPQAPSAPR